MHPTEIMDLEADRIQSELEMDEQLEAAEDPAYAASVQACGLDESEWVVHFAEDGMSTQRTQWELPTGASVFSGSATEVSGAGTGAWLDNGRATVGQALGTTTSRSTPEANRARQGRIGELLPSRIGM